MAKFETKLETKYLVSVVLGLAASAVTVALVYGTIAYVVIHFIKKFW
jgi:hypothetical protein